MILNYLWIKERALAAYGFGKYIDNFLKKFYENLLKVESLAATTD